MNLIGYIAVRNSFNHSIHPVMHNVYHQAYPSSFICVYINAALAAYITKLDH
jgi:hypothetical protein